MNVYFTGESSLVYTMHGKDWGNKTNDGLTSGFLDPGVPEVAIYTHRVFMDVVRNYDIDGIHLDYVRYPGSTWGYSPASVALYRLQTGTTRVPDPADPKWQAWRRARVTNFVRDLGHEMKLEKPNLKLSGALICFGSGPADASGWSLASSLHVGVQDWRTGSSADTWTSASR
jgi:uncharacterized lipoprotein YddW (UPF0748 family)